MVTANPDQFGNIAKEMSDDVNSASVNGMVNPIRRHLGHKEIEDVAFAMQPGQISPIISVADQYVILKCEGADSEAEREVGRCSAACWRSRLASQSFAPKQDGCLMSCRRRRTSSTSSRSGEEEGQSRSCRFH